jgi:hypothetical protein
MLTDSAAFLVPSLSTPDRKNCTVHSKVFGREGRWFLTCKQVAPADKYSETILMANSFRYRPTQKSLPTSMKITWEGRGGASNSHKMPQILAGQF